MIDRHPGPALHCLYAIALAWCVACSTAPCQTTAPQAPTTAAVSTVTAPAQDPIALKEQKLAQARATHDQRTELLELESLGALLANQQPQRSLEYLDEALAIARATNDRSSEALTLHESGRAYAALDQKQKALDLFTQALAIEIDRNDLTFQARTLTDRGHVFYLTGERQRALADCQQALSIYSELGDRKNEANLQSEIGSIFYSLGRPREALEYLNRALPTLRALHAATLANALGSLGLAYLQLGQTDESLRLLNEALTVDQQAVDHKGEASRLYQLSFVYLELGQRQQAADYLLQAVAVLRQWGTASLLAAALTNLGNAYVFLGDNDKALAAFNEALTRQAGLNEPIRDALTMCGLGRLSLQKKQPELALQDYSQALALFRKLGDREDEGGTLMMLGMTYELLGHHQNALSTELVSLSLAESLDNPDMQGEAQSNLMRYFRRQNQPEVAIFFGLDAVNSFQQIRSRMARMDNALQTSFAQSKSPTYRTLAELLVQTNRLAEAEHVLDLLKEQELKEVVRGAAGSASAKVEPVALDAAHLKGQGELATPEAQAISLTDVNLEYAALHAKPNRTWEEEARLKLLEGRIETGNAEVSAFFRDTLYPELAQQAGAADANALLSKQKSDLSLLQNTLAELGPRVLGIRLLLGEQHAYAIVITAHTRQKIVLDATPFAIRAKALQVRDDLRFPDSDPKPHLGELYAMIVAPLANELASLEAQPKPPAGQAPVPTLLWSLDGVLRYVPMAALYDGSRYMAERFNNVLFTPESYGHMTAPNDARLRVLAMGLSKSYGGMPALPGVIPELEAVVRDPADPASHGPMEGRLLSNEQFTLEALKTQLGSGSSYPVVHIASHFVVQTGVGHEEPFLLLGSEGGSEGVIAPTNNETASNSGTAGRGDSTASAGTKGYQLTLSKIEDSSISFRGTHLLTLSACNTASGAAMKDGLEMDSLGMIAQQKDAEAVLATLWSVNDMSTSRLMSDFYARWVAAPTAGKAEALRQAQLAFLRGAPTAMQGAKPSAHSPKTTGAGLPGPDAGEQAVAAALMHPYYWAPFVLIGNFQ